MNAQNMVMYLERISNGNLTINFINHLLAIICIVLCFTKIKHKEKVISGAVILLSISIVGNAVHYGNIFHLATFAILLIAAIIVFIKNDTIDYMPEKNVYTAIAAVFIILGVWYPEFVHVNAAASLLFSPLGIVPCPTLLTIGGILNLYAGKLNKKFWIYQIILVLIYGIIGTFVFKVYYDVALLLLFIFSIINLIRKTN